MKRKLKTLLCMTIVSVMLFSTVLAAPPSNDYTLLYEDHFDQGKLNDDDWYARTGERFDGLNIEEANSFEGSDLVVEFDKKEIDGKQVYTGGGVISKNLFGYGYYECRSKLYGETGGLHSSFWTMGTNAGYDFLPKYNQVIEIDGYEVDSGKPIIGHKQGQSPSNVHYYVGAHTSTGTMSGTVDFKPVDSSADYFIMGFEWLPNVIRFYLNDELIREVKNPKFYAQQNIWLTALGSTHFDKEIDDSKLPGESRWDYIRYYNRDLPGVNLIGNGEFDFNMGTGKPADKQIDLQYPVSWLESGDVDASRIKKHSDALSKTGVLEHASNGNYDVQTYQNLQFIANGKYTLSAYVRGTGNTAKFGVESDGKVFEKEIPASYPAWTKVELHDIEVTNNTAKIFVKSQGDSTKWLTVDNMNFSQVGGKGNPNDYIITPVEETKTLKYLGEIIVDNDIEGSGYKEVGDWKPSGLGGMIGKSRYLSADQKDGYATWTPKIKTPGKYVVLFSNIAYLSSDYEVSVEVITKDAKKETIIDQKNGEYSWINLGTYDLTAGTDSSVKIVPRGEIPKGMDELYIRADAVKFVPEYAFALNDTLQKSLIMSVDKNYGYVDYDKTKIDMFNPEIKPVHKDGQILVPIRYITEKLGGTIGWNQATAQATITYNEKTSYITNNSDVITIAGESINMLTTAQLIYDRTYIPLEVVRNIFGMNIFYDNVVDKNGMFIIGDFDKFLDHETQILQITEMKESFFGE